MTHRFFLVATVVTATVIAGGPPPAQAAPTPLTTPIAIWQMNEPPDARVMTDSSGNGRHGRIGNEVQPGKVIQGATAYFFPWLKPNTPPPHPEHLVTVRHDPGLDPGNRTYAVTFRMITTRRFGNIIQKGQAGSPGGYWKFQNPNGIVQCLFKGSAGGRTVQSPSPLNDGKWHIIRCERTANAVTLSVDGRVVARRTGATGSITNTVPLSIAGKINCDQMRVTCDYFPGYLDWVRIEVG